MRYIFPIIIAICFCSCSDEQNPIATPPYTITLQGWTTQKAPTSKSLTKVYFINKDTGLCVGQLGTILKTTNGGTSWELKSSPVTYNLNDIIFTDYLNGFICGDFGTVLKTIDGGESWMQLANTGNNTFYSIYSTNPVYIWVCGDFGKIYRSSNSGNSWNITNLPQSVTMYSITSGMFACGQYQYIVKSTDGGLSWVVKRDINPIYALRDITYDGFSTYYAFGDRQLKSTDQGETWNPMSIGSSSIMDSERGDHVIYTLGNKSFYKLANNDSNWIAHNYDININLQSVSFINAYAGWIAADSGYIFKTTTGGE